MERRLAAILAADVVGYSRLMGDDEVGTLHRLTDVRKTLIEPIIGRHRGHVVKLMGDGVLVEFKSVVDAVECAVAWQQGLAEREGDTPEHRRFRFRIGVNIGDVLIDGDDIFGDGVNVAARLEALAEPGGIALSDDAHRQVRDRLDLPWNDLGEHRVKNITRPVHVWHWTDDRQLPSNAAEGETARRPSRQPAIAVLPFANLSGDPDQEYFAEGIAEDIVAALSRFRDLLVIARNTSFNFKGQAANPQRVGRDLDVDYVLEGSVRKAGNRVRVSAQLIDARRNAHIWADHYDRDLDDIFAVQDEITEGIVGSVAPETLSAEVKRATRKTVDELDAWDRVLQARWHLAHFTEHHVGMARQKLQEAIAIDPDLASAFAELGNAYVLSTINGWGGLGAAEASKCAAEAARQAIQLDPADGAANAVYGFTRIFRWEFDEGLIHLRRAVEYNSNLANAYGFLSVALFLTGDYGGGLEAFDRAVRLSPRDPWKGMWLSGKGIGAFIAGRYQDVLEITQENIRDNPDLPTPYRQRAATFALLGRLDEAKVELERLDERLPNATIAQVERAVPIQDPDAHGRWLNALRTAGMPER
jgi:adenylate cyclase